MKELLKYVGELGVIINGALEGLENVLSDTWEDLKCVLEWVEKLASKRMYR